MSARIYHLRPPVEWPYCPRCGYHIADKGDVDGEVVCRFCRGHEHKLIKGSTLCEYCSALADSERAAAACDDPAFKDWFPVSGTRNGGPSDKAPGSDCSLITTTAPPQRGGRRGHRI